MNMGPTVSFNLKRLDGSWFGYHEVEKLASLSGIQLRVKYQTYLPLFRLSVYFRVIVQSRSCSYSLRLQHLSVKVSTF